MTPNCSRRSETPPAGVHTGQVGQPFAATQELRQDWSATISGLSDAGEETDVCDWRNYRIRCWVNIKLISLVRSFSCGYPVVGPMAHIASSFRDSYLNLEFTYHFWISSISTFISLGEFAQCHELHGEICDLSDFHNDCTVCSPFCDCFIAGLHVR